MKIFIKNKYIQIFFLILCINNCLNTRAQSEDTIEKVQISISKSQEEELRKIYDFFIKELGKDSAEYKFSIVKNITPNAYATIGKKIKLTTGLLEMVQSEAGLAFVIAHELGHVERKHVMKGLGTNILSVGLQIMTAVFTRSRGSTGGVGGTAQAASAFYNQSQEKSADLFAIHLINKYYCKKPGKLEFFEKISKHKDETIFQKYYSSHPLTAERLEYLELLIKDEGCVL